MAKARILVIDDEPDIQETLKMILEYEGYRHFGALTGEEGLRMIDEEHPDVIFLDLHLPGIDGVQIFAEIQQDPALRDIPVAVYLGEAESEKEQLAATGPVKAHLRKSITLDPTQYVEVLERIVRERKASL